MATKTYILIDPIKAKNEGGKDITEIVFHKPSLGELRRNDMKETHGQYEKMARLLAAGSKLPVGILDQLSWDDLRGLNEEVTDFLGLSED